MTVGKKLVLRWNFSKNDMTRYIARAKNVSKEDWTKKKIGRYEIDRLVDIFAVKKAKYKSCRLAQIPSTMMETKSNVVLVIH